MEPNISADFVFSHETNEQLIRMQSNRHIQASLLRAMHDGGDIFCDVSLFGLPSTGMQATSLIPIRAHEPVLAYASKHLYDLFTSEGYIDSHQSEYHVENVDHETLRCIVEFVYTDQLPIPTENAVDVMCRVLTGAKYLAITSLADACEKFLADDIQVKLTNCADLWSFARKYNCLALMHATSTFIAENLANMRNNAEFLCLSYDDCAKLLLSEAMIAADADQRCLSAIAWLNIDTVGRASFVHDILNMVPLTVGSVSIETIDEANKCDWLHEHGVIQKLMAGIIKNLSSVPSSVSDLILGVASSHNNNSDNQYWYVVGGSESERLFMQYDVSRRMWLNIPDLPWRRQDGSACAVHRNRLIVVGGMKNGCFTHDIDEYDVLANTWTTSCVKLSAPCNGVAICFDGTHVFALGGRGEENSQDLNIVETYAWKLGEKTQLADMNWKRSYFAAAFASNSNCIFAAGGYGSDGSIEKCNMSTDKWEEVGQSYKMRGQLAGILSGDYFYLVGGCDLSWNPVKKVGIFNIRTGQLRGSRKLPQVRYGCHGTTLNDGNVVCVVGGYDKNDNLLDTVECFDVREGKWSTGTIVPDMPKKAGNIGFAVI